MFVLPDRSRAFALYVRRLNDAADCLKRMKLRGLQPDARYHIEELDAEFWGDELMYAGLALPPLRPPCWPGWRASTPPWPKTL